MFKAWREQRHNRKIQQERASQQTRAVENEREAAARLLSPAQRQRMKQA